MSLPNGSANGIDEGTASSSKVNALPLHPADKRAPQANERKRVCVRCKTTQGSIAVQTTTYCTPCFQFAFDGKVRPMMEQTRICAFIHRTEIVGERSSNGEAQKGTGEAAKMGGVRLSERATDAAANVGRVALGLSGGASSRAMLHLAKERLLPPPGFDEAKGKPHEVFAIDVIYVDDSAIVQGAADRTEEVRALIEAEGGEAAGLHFVATRIEDAFEQNKAVICSSGFKEDRVIVNREVEANATESLKALFGALRPTKVPRTALANARSRAEDLHRLFVMHVLRREARRRGCSSLLTGENATRRAIRTIEGLGRGQGHKMAVEEASARWHDLFLLRPMSDVSSKEVAFYLRTKDMDALTPVDLVASELLAEHDSGSSNKASIGRLTESLIQLLENNVPGTINTVNRTNGKLIFHDDEASHLAIDEEADEAESLQQGTNGFRVVGPSVSLRQRRIRQREAAEEASAMNGDGALKGLEQSVRGMGLGGLGAKYYLAAQSWPRFDGAHACPLCQMPAQRGLQAWRKGLTVEKSDKAIDATRMEKASAFAAAEDGALSLSDALCYACNLLLDTPETTPAGSTMPLPVYVLEGVRSRAL